MVVDDDVDARYLVERRIRRTFPSSHVIAFPSAAAAFEELQRGTTVHAIVTDHQLRQSLGCDFIRELRRQGYTCPVIMVTCSGDPGVALTAYEAGATKVFDASSDQFAHFLKTLFKPEPDPK